MSSVKAEFSTITPKDRTTPVLVATFGTDSDPRKVAAAHVRATARDYFDDFAARDTRGLMRSNRADFL